MLVFYSNLQCDLVYIALFTHWICLVFKGMDVVSFYSDNLFVCTLLQNKLIQLFLYYNPLGHLNSGR